MFPWQNYSFVPVSIQVNVSSFGLTVDYLYRWKRHSSVFSFYSRLLSSVQVLSQMGSFTFRDVVSLVCLLSFLSAIGASRETPLGTKTHGPFASKASWTQTSRFFVLCLTSVTFYLVLKDWVQSSSFDFYFVRAWCVFLVTFIRFRCGFLLALLLGGHYRCTSQ